MSLPPCARCTADQIVITQEARKASRAHASGRSTAPMLREIAKRKADLAACEHHSMEAANDASRRRHQQARQQALS